MISNSSSQIVIQMKKINGVSVLPCTVNGLKLNFIFDTGASDVSISLTEANFMLKNGYLTEKDFVGTQWYSDANGEIEEGDLINLKSITIGGVTIKDVRASIVRNAKAPLLLGQTAISKLGFIQLDFNKNILTILKSNKLSQSNISTTRNRTDKNLIIIETEDRWKQEFSILPVNKINFKPKKDINYYWYDKKKNTVESTIGYWAGPLLNGKYVSYDSNGIVRANGNYLKGNLHGKFEYFSDSGKLIEIERYLNGMKHGIFTSGMDREFLYQNNIKTHGKRRSIRGKDLILDTPFNCKDGFSWWITDFQKKLDSQIYYTQLGVLYRIEISDSIYNDIHEYWPNGNLRRQFTQEKYHVNRKGEYLEYFDNGKIKVHGHYSIDGDPIGDWLVNNKNGTLSRKISFKRDTFYSTKNDTLFTGVLFHDIFSIDSIARNGWARIGTWVMINQPMMNSENIIPGQVNKALYPTWCPESIFNSKYREFINENQYLSDEYKEEFAQKIRWLDDYSLINWDDHHGFYFLMPLGEEF